MILTPHMPTLWRPPGVFALMKDPTSGHMKKANNGHLAKSCTRVCSHCASGTTPSSWTVTFNDLLICNRGVCCRNGALNDEAWIITAPADEIDGLTITTDQADVDGDENYCQWWKEFSMPSGWGLAWYHEVTDCSGSATNSYDRMGMRVSVDNLGFLYIDLWLQFPSASPSPDTGVFTYLFQGIKSLVDADCSDEHAVDNSITTCQTCNVGATPNFARNGTATVTGNP